MADPEEGPGGPVPPLFLDHTEAQKAEKIFFGDHPPPPPHLRVWMTGPPLILRSGLISAKLGKRDFASRFADQFNI